MYGNKVKALEFKLRRSFINYFFFKGISAEEDKSKFKTYFSLFSKVIMAIIAERT
jgi:hypothetical protein